MQLFLAQLILGRIARLRTKRRRIKSHEEVEWADREAMRAPAKSRRRRSIIGQESRLIFRRSARMKTVYLQALASARRHSHRRCASHSGRLSQHDSGKAPVCRVFDRSRGSAPGTPIRNLPSFVLKAPQICAAPQSPFFSAVELSTKSMRLLSAARKPTTAGPEKRLVGRLVATVVKRAR